MDVEKVREYCLNKKGVTESFPFDDTTLVFKVMNKMYALLNLEPPVSINLKCDPEKAVVLREEYEEVKPGYHMNKVHWNTLDLTGGLRESFVKEMIDHSYELIVAKLPKKVKAELEKL